MKSGVNNSIDYRTVKPRKVLEKKIQYLIRNIGHSHTRILLRNETSLSPPSHTHAIQRDQILTLTPFTKKTLPSFTHPPTQQDFSTLPTPALSIQCVVHESFCLDIHRCLCFILSMSHSLQGLKLLRCLPSSAIFARPDEQLQAECKQR